jgi:hypothetical protein
MNSLRLAAAVLIVAGVLGLAYDGFSCTRETHQAKLGPIEVSVQDRETVQVPIWLGAGAIVAWVLLLVVGKRR